MKAPRFWQKKPVPSFLSRLLAPVSHGYQNAVRKRLAKDPLYQSRLPVICVGNIVMGGSGKTPVVQSLVQILQQQGKQPCVLMRGYGGKIKDARFVGIDMSAALCGDEALLHAQYAPVMVSPDRVAGAHQIEHRKELTHIVMDDGFQNPSLHKTKSLVVLDGRNPFGNGMIFPSGPLRETLDDALHRADALVVLGEDVENLCAVYGSQLPVFRAQLEPVNAIDFRGKHVLAFAGIGRPEKFFATMRDCGAVLTETMAFPDHHLFTEREIADILERAKHAGTIPVTTRKDWVRLPDGIKPLVQVLDVTLRWHNPVEIERLLQKI